MKDKDGHHPKFSLPIDPESGRNWLTGEGDPIAAQTEVFNGCCFWLRRYSRGLSQETLDGITWQAMKESLEVFQVGHLSVSDALLILQRALNRLRAKEDRRRQHEQPLDEESIDSYADRRDSYEAIHVRDFWRQLVRLLERHMIGALLSLSERDQDIITLSYDLQEVSDPHRPRSYPDFPSDDAAKRALTRARSRFNEHLESLLVTELEQVLVFNRPLYEAALRIVRGGKVQRVFALLGSRRKR
jgi:hypothetical protein